MIALLFFIFLGGLVSTFYLRSKRWWGSSGYRVRIVRRNLALASAIMFLLLVGTHAAKLSLGTSRPQTKEVALPSGKKIKVIAVGQINFSHDSPALMLKYQTDLKISDLPALRREVDEIWSVFKGDVEKAHLTNAVISANEAPQGSIIQESNGYNFVFKKIDGTWRLLGNADESSGKPAP